MGKREAIAFGFLAILWVTVGIAEPRLFQSSSVESVLQWMPLLLVAAMGQLLVILTGGIDLSIGANLACSGITVGLVLRSQPGLPPAAALGLGLLCGGLLGLINAALIVGARLPAIIVTIGTLAAFRGAAFLIGRGEQIVAKDVPESLSKLARTGIQMGPVLISWLLIIGIVVSALTALFLKQTRLGRDIIATGSNVEAAHLRGISTRRVQMFVFVVCGALAGLAAVMYAGRYGFINPASAGQSFELTVIAAVAIGGAKLTGGSGSVVGVCLGCLLLASINVSLSLLGIDANWQVLAYGLVILAGVSVDGLSRRRQPA